MLEAVESFIAGHFITGFESTYMPTIGTDVLIGTRHNERFRHDFDLVRALGIRRVRYPAAWNYIQRGAAEFDWSWLDEKLDALHELDVTPILDLVHHTSIPDVVLPDGFASPDFPARLQEFGWRCAERYPWVTQYTVFNEPYLTAHFCGEIGLWFPFYRGEPAFVAMLLNICRGIVDTTNAIRETLPDARFIHVETCERHTAANPNNADARRVATFFNDRRFLTDDLLHGWVTPDHLFHTFLTENGARHDEIAWFVEHTAPIDVRGLDYYIQSEREWLSGTTDRFAERRVGFAGVAREYIERYRVPVMLSETNFFGTPLDRVNWMQRMLDEYLTLLQEGVDMQGFCWFPFVNSTDFQHMLLEFRNDIDPVGLYDLDPERWERQPTDCIAFLKEFAAQYAQKSRS